MKMRAVLVCVLVLAVTSCGDWAESSESRALSAAAAGVRKYAGEVRDKLRQDLQKKPLADTLKEIVGDETIASTTLLNSGSDSSSRFFADFAIVGSGEAGGGGDYKQVAVRLCVHYSGMVGISGQIDMADLKCPEGLPATVRGVDVKKNISLAS